MLRRAHVAILLIVALTLTGCFRQAEEPIDRLESSQPISNTAAPTDVPTLETDTQPTQPEEAPTDEEPTDEEPTDSEEPAIQITVETSTPIAPTDIPPTDVPPTDLPAPTEEEAANGGVDPVPVEDPTATPQIVTPGVPSGPSAINTPTPQPLEATPPPPSDRATPTSPVTGSSDECIYVVQPGDNLYRISVNNNTPLQALRDANPQIVGDLIQPGDEINLPNCDATGGPVEEPDEVVEPQPTVPQVTGPQTIHVVKAGETLFQIARQYGVSISAITEANNLVDPDRLSVGQELVIPPPN